MFWVNVVLVDCKCSLVCLDCRETVLPVGSLTVKTLKLDMKMYFTKMYRPVQTFQGWYKLCFLFYITCKKVTAEVKAKIKNGVLHDHDDLHHSFLFLSVFHIYIISLSTTVVSDRVVYLLLCKFFNWTYIWHPAFKMYMAITTITTIT